MGSETSGSAKKASRRSFIGGSVGIAATGALAPTLAAYADRRRRGKNRKSDVSPYGPLFPKKDATTGLPLLKLPRGFRYASVGWTGDVMSDGTLTPDRHDGMAVVSAGRRPFRDVVLIRNHERGGSDPDNPLPTVGAGQAPTYDPFALPGVLSGLGGGTTTMRFRHGRLIGDHASLAGTLTNCAGGPTPWGSWLTCEEVTIKGALLGAKDHGYVFEVPGPDLGVVATANPIRDMGLMDHEAVAVDPQTSFVYLTEDNGPNSGFYQFRPNNPAKRVGALEEGGELYMLKVKGVENADLINVEQGTRYDVEWVRVAEPEADPEGLEPPAPGFPPIAGVGKSGPFLQGEALGAAFFNRGEGCWYGNRRIYFVDTSGGPARSGVVWSYNPRRETLRALFVSPDSATADNPDNITVSPSGGLLVCEDGSPQVDGTGAIVAGLRMLGINRDGSSYVFAENNLIIEEPLPGRPFIEPEDYRNREWAGACFDPFGRYLFVNIQTPGVTFVIAGPWRRGPL